MVEFLISAADPYSFCVLITPSVKGMHKEMGNNCWIRSDWKFKIDPPSAAR